MEENKLIAAFYKFVDWNNLKRKKSEIEKQIPQEKFKSEVVTKGKPGHHQSTHSRGLSKETVPRWASGGRVRCDALFVDGAKHLEPRLEDLRNFRPITPVVRPYIGTHCGSG